MKRLLPLAASAAITFGAMTGMAAATENCTIKDTGANSNNRCITVVENTATITCDNDLHVFFNNKQDAGSGSVNVTNVSSTGGSYSGKVGNTNLTDLDADVSCAPATVAAAPTPAPTPTPAPAPQVQAATTTAALPNTGSNPLVTSGIVALVLGVAAGLVQFGSKAYKAYRS